jgi:RsiW-degrading membrane proteinase PrsW (M82 family)
MTALIIGVGFPLGILFVMYFFGMYNLRNAGWVLFCVICGAVGYGASFLLNTYLLKLGISREITIIIFTPLIQQIFISLGVLFVVYRQKFDNLVDGAVYGVSAGLGYALLANTEYALGATQAIEIAFLRCFSTTLVLATASGIVGLIMTQFYFRHRDNRLVILLSGLGVAIGYNALFNLLVTRGIGGEILPVTFGIGGITLVGLYITGQLRKILIQLAMEKKRSESLLEIVIPIGVQLSTEKNFARLHVVPAQG